MLAVARRLGAQSSRVERRSGAHARDRRVVDRALELVERVLAADLRGAQLSGRDLERAHVRVLAREREDPRARLAEALERRHERGDVAVGRETRKTLKVV